MLGPHTKYKKLIDAGKKARSRPRVSDWKLLKQRILGAFYELDGIKGLVKFAKESDDNRKFVYNMIIRLIPTERLPEEGHAKGTTIINILTAIPRPGGNGEQKLLPSSIHTNSKKVDVKYLDQEPAEVYCLNTTPYKRRPKRTNLPIDVVDGKTP